MTMILCMCCHSQKPSKYNESNQLKRNNQANDSSRMHCGLAWLPLSMSSMGLLTIIMTYLFAVGSGHISPILPYISDTGIEYPESSIFSLCMDIVAFLLVLTVYVTYYLIGHFAQIYDDEHRNQRIERVNKGTFVVGVIAASGLSILANFPEDENLMIHLVGAFFCFTFGVMYCFLHTWLSFKISPEFSPPYMCFLRLSISSFALLTFALLILFGTALRWHADAENPQPYYKRISAAFEWILVVTIDLYFVTFALEYRKIKLTHTFQHYSGGSWVEFTPLSASSSATQSEDTNSTRSANSYLVNSNYVINYAQVKCHQSNVDKHHNIYHHNNGMPHQNVYQQQNMLSAEQNICQHNNKLSAAEQNICQHNNKLSSAEQNVCQHNNKSSAEQNIFQHQSEISLQNLCQHNNGTAHILPTGEWCIGWATTV